MHELPYEEGITQDSDMRYIIGIIIYGSLVASALAGVSQQYTQLLSRCGVEVDACHGKAIEGDMVAQLVVGAMCEDRLLICPEGAVSWYLKAAAAGLAEAQFVLARTYLVGDLIARDARLAVDWLRRAAAQGETNSQIALGLIYLQGDAVTQNNAEAYYWLVLAEQLGDYSAKSRRQQVREQLTAQARLDIEHRSRSWEPMLVVYKSE